MYYIITSSKNKITELYCEMKRGNFLKFNCENRDFFLDVDLIFNRIPRRKLVIGIKSILKSAQVSFSDNLFVRSSVNVFTFSTSSPQPLGQF